MEELGAGVHRWTARHPEYRTTAEEVASYAIVAGEGVALVDPLLPQGCEGVQLLEQLDTLAHAASRVDLMITIPYHTRSAEALWRRWQETVPTHIWGHRAVRRRYEHDGTPLDEIVADGPLGPLAQACAIGRPRRYETPLYFPGQRALAFGDAIVALPDGSLRVWAQGKVDETWYRERFLPTLEPLVQLDLALVLVAHGPAVGGRGRAALREALAAPPVTRYW